MKNDDANRSLPGQTLEFMLNRNPYESPSSTRLDLPDAHAKKPIAAWLLQLICLLFMLSFGVGLVQFFMLPAAGESGKLTLLDLSWRLMFVVAVGATLVGTQRGALYGRVLGLMMIVLISVVALLPQLIGERSPLAVLSKNNFSAYETGELLGLALCCGAIGYWFYAFGFSEKARRYFAPRRRVAANDS